MALKNKNVRLKDHYLLIISMDGLSKVDIERVKDKPAFKQYLDGASGSINVTSVYPSLTYCAHTSITTGVYPNKHGIINNTRFQPGRFSPDWYWYARDIKVPTLQKLAKRTGYRILSIFWPVTAAANIDYNMPEIFANRPWQNQISVSLKNGTMGYQIKMNRLFGKERDGMKEPQLDNFSHKSFLYSLENYNAEINMVHYIDLDSQRHDYGFSSKEAMDALDRLDSRLGDIIRVLKKTGKYDKSTIIVLGDHSSIDGHSNLYVNTALRDAGLLEADENGLVKTFRAYCKSADGAAYIYAKKEATNEQILNAIKPLLDCGAIADIVRSEEAKRLGADEKCRFILEAAEGYFFKNMVKDRVIIPVEELRGKEDVKMNNHGYSPWKKNDYETVFFMKGKGVKPGVMIDKMSLVDEGPTMAALLGIKMGDVDGRVLDDLLDFEAL